MTDRAREHRSAVAADNPFVAWQENVSKQIVAALDAWRDARESRRGTDASLRSMVRPRCRRRSASIPRARNALRRPAKDPLARRDVTHADRRTESAHSGRRPARSLVRALLYVGMARGAVDERGFEVVRRIRARVARVGRCCRCRNSRRLCASNSTCC